MPKWYSTVLGLMKSCAAISRLVFPCATRRGDLCLLGGELVEGIRWCVPGRVLPSLEVRCGPARRTPPSRTPRRTRVRSATVRARRGDGVPVAATRRRAVERGRGPPVVASARDDRSPHDGVLGIVPASEQSPRTGLNAKGPRRATRARRCGRVERASAARSSNRCGSPPRSTRPKRSSRTTTRVEQRSPAQQPRRPRRIAPDRWKSSAFAQCETVNPIPSPSRRNSSVLVSIDRVSSFSRPRNAATVSTPYGGTMRPSVASASASASSTSAEAAAMSPPNKRHADAGAESEGKLGERARLACGPDVEHRQRVPRLVVPDEAGSPPGEPCPPALTVIRSDVSAREGAQGRSQGRRAARRAFGD